MQHRSHYLSPICGKARNSVGNAAFDAPHLEEDAGADGVIQLLSPPSARHAGRRKGGGSGVRRSAGGVPASDDDNTVHAFADPFTHVEGTAATLPQTPSQTPQTAQTWA